MNIPEPGFYYHYKHDESKDVSNYSYEVTRVVRHSEDKSFLMAYKPLYDAPWLTPAEYVVRPIEMFFDEVEYQGKKLPRFWKITDPALIEKLSEIKDQLYPTS